MPFFKGSYSKDINLGQNKYLCKIKYNDVCMLTKYIVLVTTAKNI